MMDKRMDDMRTMLRECVRLGRAWQPGDHLLAHLTGPEADHCETYWRFGYSDNRVTWKADFKAMAAAMVAYGAALTVIAEQDDILDKLDRDYLSPDTK